MTDPVKREYRGNALILTVDNPPVNVISQAVRAALLAAALSPGPMLRNSTARRWNRICLMC